MPDQNASERAPRRRVRLGPLDDAESLMCTTHENRRAMAEHAMCHECYASERQREARVLNLLTRLDEAEHLPEPVKQAAERLWRHYRS